MHARPMCVAMAASAVNSSQFPSIFNIIDALFVFDDCVLDALQRLLVQRVQWRSHQLRRNLSSGVGDARSERVRAEVGSQQLSATREELHVGKPSA